MKQKYEFKVDYEDEAKTDVPRFWISVRSLMCVMLFFGYCFNYMQKIDMSIAIVCMVNQTALKQMAKYSPDQNLNHTGLMNQSTTASISTNHQSCASNLAQINGTSHKLHDGPFVWPKNVQGLILSAYFYGYILTQIPGGWLSFRFGGRNVLCFSMGIGSSFTMLIPVCARLSYIALFICLFLTGASHGSFWPSISSFWAFWAPTRERSRLVGMSSSGSKVGNIIALSLGSILCLYGFDGGWPSIFYLFGGCGVIWSIAFYLISSDSPKTHKFISSKEKEYILEETKKAIKTRELCQSRVPWKNILFSKPSWAIFIGHFAHNWGMYLFLTQTPSFLKDVLKFDIKSNGFISSIPYIASWITLNISSIASDQIMKRTNITRTNLRRIFFILGMFLPGVVILGLSFIGCSNVYLGVALLTLGVCLDAIMTGAGYLVCINDIAGPYSGILYGVSNSIGTIPGIISPYIASLITKNQTQQEWQIVFIICACVYFVGCIISVILLDARLQPWAKIEEQIINDDILASNFKNDKILEKNLEKF